MSIYLNPVTIGANYSLQKNDKLAIITANSIAVDLPITTNQIDVTNGAQYLIDTAGFAFTLQTIDGTAFNAGGTTYVVSGQRLLLLEYVNGLWYVGKFDQSSGGSPGGPVGSYQFNNGSVFDGNIGLTYNGSNILAYDSVFRIVDDALTTRYLAWNCGNITAATTRTITMVDFSGTQVLSNGALTSTRIPFSTTTGLTDSANLIWDSVNNQLELINAGSAAQPSLMFGTSIGWYQVSSSNIGLSISSVLRHQMDVNAAYSGITGGYRCAVSPGSAASVVFGPQDDLNTGIWFQAADQINISVGGTDRMTMDTTNIFGSANGAYLLRHGAGAAATPTYSFRNDTDTGFYSDAANTIKWSTGGTQRGTIDSTGRTFIGAATAPNAFLHITAGTTSNAPIQLTTGTSRTTAVAGSIEFTTDDLFFTITTGTARKRVLLADPTAGLTTGRVPYATTNGRLTDTSTFLFSGTLLSVGTTTATAFINAAASTTSNASLRFISGTAPTAPNDGDTWNDSTQKALQTFLDGIKQTQVGCIFTQTADQTVTNTTTETTVLGTGVGTKTLPANFWVIGKTLRLRVGGVYSTPITGAVATIRVKYGTTTIATVSTTALLSNATDLEFDGEVTITCRTTGVTGAVITHGDIEYLTGTAGTLAVDPLNNAGSTTTIDTTTSNALDVTVQWDTASASKVVKSTICFIEVLN